MRLSTLVGVLGVSSVASAGPWSNVGKTTSALSPAIGKSFSNGLAGVSKVAAIYGPMVVDQSGDAAKWVWENKALSGCVIGGVIVVAPGLVSAPLLPALGYTAAGVKGASLASGIQSVVGNVAAGSVFATLQSAGAGGAGLALANTAIQSSGAVMMGSSGVLHIKSKL